MLGSSVFVEAGVGRHSFGATAGRMMRAAARAERVRQQDLRRQIAAAHRNQKLTERQLRLDAKERQREYVASRQEEADELSREIAEREKAINGLLSAALDRSPRLDVQAIKQTFKPGAFAHSRWERDEPKWEIYEPKRPSFLVRFIPGSGSRYQRRLVEARERHRSDLNDHRHKMEEEGRRRLEFETEERERKQVITRFNNDVDRMVESLNICEHEAVVRYYGLLLERSFIDDCDAVGAEVGYSPESKHLIVDLELPDLDVVPEEASYKFIKSSDRIDPVARLPAKRKMLYASLVSQAVLKATDAVFRGGRSDVVDILTINGMLETVDPSTGQNVRPCLVSARISADTFARLRLSAVNPEQCLRSLKASVSRSPAELLPVKPLVEMSMVDPRFIETRDVMSGLDTRPNLMDLTPNEFESLIAQLFEAMGLQTRQTQASRDGGVDCVAFDLRPIFGGKVVIQAKRYKGTVGVSAVRDLYGTMQNEGANRGILVTTSGYGKASLEFAKEKPLELIDGGGLLHLLAEHAKIEARIVMPTEWIDRSNTGD